MVACPLVKHALGAAARASCRTTGHRFFSVTVRRADGAETGVRVGSRVVEIVKPEFMNSKRLSLPNLWLRDNCRCVKCVNQDTMQRNFNTFEIPNDISAAKAVTDKSGLSVAWSDNGHQSHYSWDFIDTYCKRDHVPTEAVPLRLWGSEISTEPPTAEYSRVMDTSSDAGIAELTNMIRTFGFAFVSGCPSDDPQHTQALLERIAFIRITHYGGFYDFVPDLAMADTAYTNLALPAHTDTTYFSDPAGLQSFHLLSHTAPPGAPKDAPASGGQSLLVDGFYAAKLLKERDPRAYEILSKVRLPWHASGNQGITIAPDKRYPVLETDEATGELLRVRWNNDDRGVVPFDDGISPEDWYDSARKWDAILRDGSVEYLTQLVPGKPLIFDNWRVLHGRRAFEGLRRICGGYINRDDFISRWRNTNYPREEILRHVIG